MNIFLIIYINRHKYDVGIVSSLKINNRHNISTSYMRLVYSNLYLILIWIDKSKKLHVTFKHFITNIKRCFILKLVTLLPFFIQ